MNTLNFQTAIMAGILISAASSSGHAQEVSKPAEQQAIKVLSGSSWKERCPYKKPSVGWRSIEDDANGTFHIYPKAGQPFAQYDFSFDVKLSTMGPILYVYLSNVNWEQAALIPGFDRDLFDEITKVRELYPATGASFPTEAYAMLHSMEISRVGADKNGSFKVWVENNLEDGVGLHQHHVSVFTSDGTRSASMGISEYIPMDVEWREDGRAQDLDQVVREFTCTASDSMALEPFMTICELFIEEQLEVNLECMHTGEPEGE